MATLEERFKQLQTKIDRKKKVDEAKKQLEAAKKALKAARGK
jgi:hypothetical protein